MVNPLYKVEVKGKNPLVVLELEKYEALISGLEDLQDRISILERSSEPDISQEEVDKKFTEMSFPKV